MLYGTWEQQMDSPASVRRSSLCCLLLVFLCCGTFIPLSAEGFPQAPSAVDANFKTPTGSERHLTESDLREAIQRVEELAKALEARTYRQHLREALSNLGYGLHHPLFRTSLNGFEQRQIDLEDADEFKMGSFAFSLRSGGQPLRPDPFDDWLEVQLQLEAFEPTLDRARRIVAGTSILAANTTANIPFDVFRKLSKRWRSAVVKATDAYENALAIRAVQYVDGQFAPAPQTLKFILYGGQYAIVCPMGECASLPAANHD
jgi:hypothetical protein